MSHSNDNVLTKIATEDAFIVLFLWGPEHWLIKNWQRRDCIFWGKADIDVIMFWNWWHVTINHFPVNQHTSLSSLLHVKSFLPHHTVANFCTFLWNCPVVISIDVDLEDLKYCKFTSDSFYSSSSDKINPEEVLRRCEAIGTFVLKDMNWYCLEDMILDQWLPLCVYVCVHNMCG